MYLFSSLSSFEYSPKTGQFQYSYFRDWKCDGTWERIHTALRQRLRVKMGREPEPSASIIDSQTVKTSAVRGDDRGYDGGKKILGRKRHLLVDTQGFLLSLCVHSANIPDRDGAKRLLEPLGQSLPSPPTRVGRWWIQRQATRLGQRALGLETGDRPTPVGGHTRAPEGTIIDWDTVIPKGFHVLPRRWVIERTNAWISGYRRLSRDFEGLYASSVSLILIAMSKLMLTRLATLHG